MKLDSRIIKGKKPLSCFDTEQAKEFLGKECYFSDHLCTFNELLDAYSYVTADLLVSKEKHLYVGELLTVGDSDGSCYEASINGEAEWFQFCLPCEWVEEPKKKYRAFTNIEFVDLFDSGKLRSIRLKDNSTKRLERLIITDIYVQGDYLYAKLNSSDTGYGPAYFFSKCEYFDGKEWQPFGVIDE